MCVCATENVCVQYSMFTRFSGSQSAGSVVSHPFQAALAWAVMWAWLDPSFTSLWMQSGRLFKGPVNATSCGSGIPWQFLNSQSLYTVGTNNYIQSLVSGSMPTQAMIIAIYGLWASNYLFKIPTKIGKIFFQMKHSKTEQYVKIHVLGLLSLLIKNHLEVMFWL